MKPPHLGALGYELIGGRLSTWPASNSPRPTRPSGSRNRGKVNVFYWIDGTFGYAISAGVDKAELQRVATEVHRQLAAT